MACSAPCEPSAVRKQDSLHDLKDLSRCCVHQQLLWRNDKRSYGRPVGQKPKGRLRSLTDHWETSVEL